MAASIYQFSITPDCRYLNMKVIGNPGNATATFFNNGEQIYEYNFVMLDNQDIDNIEIQLHPPNNLHVYHNLDLQGQTLDTIQRI